MVSGGRGGKGDRRDRYPPWEHINLSQFFALLFLKMYMVLIILPRFAVVSVRLSKKSTCYKRSQK